MFWKLTKRKQRRAAAKNIRAHAVPPLPEDRPFSLATEHFIAGRLRKAERLYRQILAAQPSHASSLHNLGLLYLERDKKADAVELLRKAVGLQSDNPQFLTALGLALQMQGQRQQALEVFQNVLALQPDYNAAYKHLVYCLGEAIVTGQYQQANRATPLQEPRNSRKISVIICSINPAKQTKVTANYEALLAGTDYELIVINDAKSLCEGYNRGIARSSGDVLIFSHDDIEIVCAEFSHKLFYYLNCYDMIAVAGTDRLLDSFWGTAGWPHVHGQVIHQRPGGFYEVFVFGFDPIVQTGIQAVDGLFFAINRHVLDSVRFDEERFTGFHFYDIDFSFSAFLAGFSIAVCSDILLIHASTARLDEDWKSHATVFERKFSGRFASPPPAASGNDVVNVKFNSSQEAVAFCQRIVEAGYRISAQRHQ